MNLMRLAWKNANGSAFRSAVVFLCAALMAGFAVAATIIIGGAQDSLELALERLGADVIVVAEGSEDLMENAFLMGVPARTWMPRENVDRIAQLDGVEAVSPQIFLSTLRGATCCSVPEMFLVGYDPETDFTLRPWLEQHAQGGLALGEAVGGDFVYVPADPGYILVYGYEITLRGNLKRTGTGIDQTMFFTFDTAYDISNHSADLALEELQIPPDSVSAAMVKVVRGSSASALARQVEAEIPGVRAVESSNLFHSQRIQIVALLRSVVALLGVAWLLFVALIAVVYAIAINERRREIGVLRALGFARPVVLRSLLAEGLILALAGGIGGITFSIFAVYLFRNLIIQLLGVPFLLPAPLPLLALAVGALLLALVSVTLGALVPSVRINRLEPALAMRK